MNKLMSILNGMNLDNLSPDKKREKELKTIKAQNEMLEMAKQTVIEHFGDGSEQSDIVKQIDAAQEQNIELAKNTHSATVDDINSLQYNEVNKTYENAYNKLVEEKNKRQADIIKEQKEKSKASRNSGKKQQNVNVYDTDYKNKIKTVSYDLSQIPDYVQYDIIPLPSNGECYPVTSPLRSGVIPVSYLTAADENLIFSPNMYRNGQIVDVILSRKILDKSITPDMLCKGDRDAIILWLRATGYGDEFPIVVRNPNNTEKIYNTEIKLSSLKYLDFSLKGDENGFFDFKTSKGDILKFKCFTNKDESDIKEIVSTQILSDSKYHLYNAISDAKYYLDELNKHTNEVDEETLNEMTSLYEWVNNLDESLSSESITANIITEEMIMRTISVNGNTDLQFIRNYIENLRAKDAYEYRKYILNNAPGVDFKINVTIPESDGGGSFETFLRIDDYIFRNIAE